jgi:hypothetical protein
MTHKSSLHRWLWPAIALGIGVQVPVSAAGFSAPVLKWSRGGCYSSWCETGWYSSPALVDVNGDGKLDVVASAYSLVALNGPDGHLLWRAGGISHRTWPGIVVADIDKNGKTEIVTAQSGGYLTVYNLAGQMKWQKQPTTSELRGLLAADLDGNGSSLELVVTGALGSKTNTWVYNSNGTLRTGWPQLNNGNGYAWGVYNANAAAGNLDSSDARLELVVPSDVHYINAYKPDGSLLRANSNVYPGKTYWGQVGIWENLAIEKRGWGACDGIRAESYRANFADGPAVIADMNGDGKREVVVAGNMYDCYAGYPPSRYTALYIFTRIARASTAAASTGAVSRKILARHWPKITPSSKPLKPIPSWPTWTATANRKSCSPPTMAGCMLTGWIRPSTAPGPTQSINLPKASSASPLSQPSPTWTTTAKRR